MPFSPTDRKVALVRLGVRQNVLAKQLGVHQSVVSNVIWGYQTSGIDAEKVMRYLAKKWDVPVAEAFPELEGKVA